MINFNIRSYLTIYSILKTFKSLPDNKIMLKSEIYLSNVNTRFLPILAIFMLVTNISDAGTNIAVRKYCVFFICEKQLLLFYHSMTSLAL